MSGKNRFRKGMKGLAGGKASKHEQIPGILGIKRGGAKKVEVPNRNGYVYVRLHNNISELVQAYNDSVSPVYDLPVLVERAVGDSSHYRVVGRDLGVYQNWGSNSSYLPKHGNTHSFNPENGGGQDVAWVYPRQFTPLQVYPSGTSGGIMNVMVHGDIYYWNGDWRFAGGTGTADMSPYKPTGTSARLLMVYLDENGNPNFEVGNHFAATLTGTSQVVDYVPGLPIQAGIPLGAVRLVSGTSVVAWDNIYDLRPLIVGGGFIPTGTWATTTHNHDATYAPISHDSYHTGTFASASHDKYHSGTYAVKEHVADHKTGGFSALFNTGFSKLSLVTGTISLPASYPFAAYAIDMEGGTGTADNLDGIIGGANGDMLLLVAYSPTGTVTCRNATGNVHIGSDFDLDNVDDTLLLILRGTNWLLVGKNDNGG